MKTPEDLFLLSSFVRILFPCSHDRSKEITITNKLWVILTPCRTDSFLTSAVVFSFIPGYRTGRFKEHPLTRIVEYKGLFSHQWFVPVQLFVQRLFSSCCIFMWNDVFCWVSRIFSLWHLEENNSNSNLQVFNVWES